MKKQIKDFALLLKEDKQLFIAYKLELSKTFADSLFLQAKDISYLVDICNIAAEKFLNKLIDQNLSSEQDCNLDEQEHLNKVEKARELTRLITLSIYNAAKDPERVNNLNDTEKAIINQDWFNEVVNFLEND